MGSGSLDSWYDPEEGMAEVCFQAAQASPAGDPVVQGALETGVRDRTTTSNMAASHGPFPPFLIKMSLKYPGSLCKSPGT